MRLFHISFWRDDEVKWSMVVAENPTAASNMICDARNVDLHDLYVQECIWFDGLQLGDRPRIIEMREAY